MNYVLVELNPSSFVICRKVPGRYPDELQAVTLPIANRVSADVVLADLKSGIFGDLTRYLLKV